MTAPAKSTRNQPVYRVEVHDRINGRKVVRYATRNGPPFPNGFPRFAVLEGRSPEALWVGKDARAIAAALRSKRFGTSLDARVVKDARAVEEVLRRQPTGEAA